MKNPEAQKKLSELEAVKLGLTHLLAHVFSLKERLTPRKDAWGGQTDARRMALGNIYRPCLTNPTLLFNMLVTLSKEEELNEFARLIGMPDDKRNRENAFWDITWFVLTNTLLMFQFQIENLFQNLWRELGNDEERSFLKLSEKLLLRLKVPDVGEKLKRLRALAYLRNSLHNNGIHSGPDFAFRIYTTIKSGDITIQVDANYAFKKGGAVNCCGPMHVLGICHGVVDVVKDVISAPDINAIAGPIRDRFAWAV